eukprot:Em0004g1314a
MSDQFSKWVEAVAVPTKEAHRVASALYKIFMQMGLPNVLTTDNGSEFRNKLNAAMLKKLGIRHSFILLTIHRLAHAPNTSNQMAQVAKERQEILKDVKRNILAAQSAFAHSLQSVYATAFQSTSAHSLQSVYTTAFQSVYTTAFQSVYTTSVYTTAIPVSLHHSIPVNCQQLTPVSPYLRVLISLITFVKSDKFNYIFSFWLSIKHYSGSSFLQ